MSCVFVPATAEAPWATDSASLVVWPEPEKWTMDMVLMILSGFLVGKIV
jgi:hypothetical protein